MQFGFEFFDPLFDHRPLIVIPPETQGFPFAISHQYPKRVSRHLQKPAPHGLFTFTDTFTDYYKSTLLIPPL